ncbi:MAG: LacI family DNA-binding transcriptional regulator [Oscillospiraceae bacterium]|nr:LacI family DNA-binding transcriptional regulator [Oscillospiraceae bacterium]
MSKVTIQDIADALGVSRNTVSKAINNADGLADATREKILQKAVEMGYKQFSYVRAVTAVAGEEESTHPSPGFRGEIALLTTAFLNQSHFASLMLDKFQREISQLGYTLNTHRVSPEDLKNGTLPITFVPERTSAILCIEMFDFAYDEMVCALGLPVLFVDGPSRRHGRTLNADQLYMDNTAGIIRFVYDMLGRGYKRLGFIGDYEHCQSFFERYAAFRGAMLMAGVEVEDRFLIKANKPWDLLEPLSALTEMPDAFLCANDFVALDAMQILSDRGLSVPKDVMICGFDDSAESRSSKPTLTTIHIHTQVMAFSAVQLLMSRIKEPSLDFRFVHTQTDLIYRDSTAR